VRVRGLKPLPGHWMNSWMMSHPVRVRGLKQLFSVACCHDCWSHPVRVRGLKPYVTSNTQIDNVAPRAGAWIETNG